MAVGQNTVRRDRSRLHCHHASELPQSVKIFLIILTRRHTKKKVPGTECLCEFYLQCTMNGMQ